jgi:nitrilase
VHRKLNPTLWEMLYHTRGDGGDNIRVFDTEIGRVGGLICGEHLQFPLVHNLIVQNEQINCSLWPGSRKWSLKTEIQVMTRAVCLGGAMFGISACACIPEELQPKNFYPNAALDRTGGSSIVDPMGDYIAGPVYDVETIVYGDIDLGMIPQSKSIHNLTGSYSRWDIFSLATRQEPYQAVSPLDTHETGGQPEELSRAEARIAGLEAQVEALRSELKRGR